ncbi:hypothetical protein L227DRAFT_538683, partial [Lentinus tigrinus ALCF2SS1-6]
MPVLDVTLSRSKPLASPATALSPALSSSCSLQASSTTTTMSTTTPPDRVPFRTFSCPTVHPENKVALGRNHASWFLVYPTPSEFSGRRVAMCLNFVALGDTLAVGACSPAGNPVFAVGGTDAESVMSALSCMRDEADKSPVAFSNGKYPEDNEFGLRADVEVLVPENELMYACARCGKWEALHGPRFLRCSGCKSRYYCSVQCQTFDWKTRYHKDECGLLKQGKAHEVESRRKLHNNGWWFDHSPIGNNTLLADSGEHTLSHALQLGDYDYLAYGRRSPPPDVPQAQHASL